MKLTKILSPTDFSKNSGFALEWAAYLAQCMKAELILLHVMDEEEVRAIEEVVGGGSIVQIPKEIQQNVLEECRKKFKEQLNLVLPNELKKMIQVKEILRTGNPFSEIIHAAAEEEVDLIVLGSHGRRGLAHVLIGSVAERVVHHAFCPVLTIKHPQYRYAAPLKP